MVRFDHPNRREVLRTLAAGAVGTAAAHSWVDALTALAQTHAHTQAAGAVTQSAEWKPRVLTAPQNAAVVVLAELIIPQTDTPGAKAAGVNRFVDTVLQEATPDDREKFLRGLAWMDEQSTLLFGKVLVDADASEQIRLLTRLADEGNTADADRVGIEFFRALKSMTITGYYSTEIGLRQELGDDGRLAMSEFAGCDHPEHVDR